MGFLYKRFGDYRPEKKNKTFTTGIAKQHTRTQSPWKQQINKELISKMEKTEKKTKSIRIETIGTLALRELKNQVFIRSTFMYSPKLVMHGQGHWQG